MISAEVVLASSSPHAKTLYTLQLRYPWFIHGELMTHRVLSRNASSNRAIPLRKMLEEVRSDELRAEPVKWGTEQKGMSPGDELDDARPFAMLFNTDEEAVEGMATRRHAAKHLWRAAALKAAEYAEELHAIGLHKSICNRLVMPFTHANVIVTATELDNFFGLRLQADVDPTMRALTEAMWVAVNEAKSQALQPGDWHLPFVSDMRGEDGDALHQFMVKNETVDVEQELAIKVSVARCARVSYMSHDTGRRSTVEEDLALYERLLGGLSDPTKPLHASPAEHQATPDGKRWDENGSMYWLCPSQHGNLIGWRQYRKMLPGEAVAPLPDKYKERGGVLGPEGRGTSDDKDGFPV